MSASAELETDVKTRILDAAADAFMVHGFANTTIDDIADQVGATKGLIYYHFRSKFDIFLAVYQDGMRRVRERVEPQAGGPGTGRQRLTAMSVAHLENLMTELGYHHVVHQGVRYQASTALKARQRDALAALNELRRDYERMFRRVVAEGVADGSLRVVDESLATRTLLSNLNAVDMWYRRIEGQTADEINELARNVVDLLIGGMANP
ncbi:TetR/AcrR family transcriptional regulator [Mycolicibacterium goodii]|uniref:TetR family transcriptional regulator n=1 Tax=Mycolicibacterium goodii TaxID=134601 RepID=A0A0K0X5Q6_MYCGD|nr:TetR family transcriptional regulator [Mycolicibacterium goodii]